MHLANDVPNASHVEFVGFKVVAHELRDLADQKNDFSKLIGREFVEVFDALCCLRNNDEPGKGGIVLKANLAGAGFADEMGALIEAGVKFKRHVLKKVAGF